MWRATTLSSAPSGLSTTGFVERRMAHQRADRERLSVACEPVEPGDLIDIDKMRRLAPAETP